MLGFLGSEILVFQKRKPPYKKIAGTSANPNRNAGSDEFERPLNSPGSAARKIKKQITDKVFLNAFMVVLKLVFLRRSSSLIA